MQAHIKNILLHLSILINFTTCRDFYLGMFKKNDLLMSHDALYKEKVPFRFMYAKYGRTYNCPITYVRVIDRLNIGRGPRVEIIRGGLRKKYIVLRLTSPYNTPISVNIFVGCENKKFTNPPWKIIRPITKTTVTESAVKTKEESTTNEVITEKEAGEAETSATTVLDGKNEETMSSKETTVAEEEHAKGGNEGGGEGGEGGGGGEGGEGGGAGEGGEGEGGGEGGGGGEGERKK